MAAGPCRATKYQPGSRERLPDLGCHARTTSRRSRALRVGDLASGGCSIRPGGIGDGRPLERRAEIGDPRRFTEGGFAPFNGSAPLPCSSGEGSAQPVRHCFNPGGNRRVNAVLHHMAITQLRCEPRARELYELARQRGHTNTEDMRILKRKLSDVVYRCMIRDGTPTSAAPLLT
jgi:transposase